MRFLKGFGILGLALLIGGSVAWAETGKKASVDISKVFDEYQKTKDNDRILQGAGRKKEEERDAMVREVRQMKDELALIADEAAKAKKQEALNAKVKTLEEFDRTTRQGLAEQRNTVLREIFKDIDDTVKRYGDKNGFDFVFNERALLYTNPQYDVTKDIVEELNKNYKGGKKA